MASIDFCCHACLMDKPANEQSPDPRYCQGCYEVLEQEASLLTERGYTKHPAWWPVAQNQGKKEKIPTIPQSRNMSTLNGKKSEVDIIDPPVGKVTSGKRGPKKKALPWELIKQWAGEDMGSKAIATRLKRELGIKISYKTIQRLLSS